MIYKLYTLDNQFIKESIYLPLNFTGICCSDIETEWFFNGKRHRLDGPAIEHPDGAKWWYVNGGLHRLDGPAIKYSDGQKAWYIDGKLVTKEQHALLRSIMKLKGLI